MASILVVDDSRSIRMMIEFALKSRGYTVVMATDGVDAQERLSQTSIDLVLLDVHMPRLDGFGLLEVMRSRREWARVPVIMLTTKGRDEDRDRALMLGATDYMVKPFRPAELLDRIESLLT